MSFSARAPSGCVYEWTHALRDVHLAWFWVRIKHQLMHRLSCLFELKSIFIHTGSWKLLCEHTFPKKSRGRIYAILNVGGTCDLCPWLHNICLIMLISQNGLIIIEKKKVNYVVCGPVLVMWSEKVSWSLIITPRFLAVFEGVMVEEPNWKVNCDEMMGLLKPQAVLARLSWRWWSFIQLETSVRHAEMRAAIVGSSGWMRGKVSSA